MRREETLAVLLAVLALSMSIVDVVVIIPEVTPYEEWSEMYGGPDSDEVSSVQ